MTGDVWARLRDGLVDADVRAHAGDARVGATLALLGERDGDLEVVYTRRCDDLRVHPGQISFPGGRVENGEPVTDAALREAAEEVGLRPATAAPMGALPAFYVPPSRFWLQTVVARWERPHRLQRAEDEVAEIVPVRVSHLTDPSSWRSVRLSARGWSWAWQLDADHLLWGATAVATAALLDVVAPRWHGGMRPEDLDGEREVRPWLAAGARSRGRVALSGLPTVAPSALARPWSGPADRRVLPAVGRGVARVVDLVSDGHASVLVLAGAGGNGLAGLAAARALAQRGRAVTVCAAGPAGRLAAETAAELSGLAHVAFAGGDLPRAGVVVDALVGGGLRGPLTREPQAAVRALQRRRATIVSVDVPTGLDSAQGLVGEVVAADATVALGGLRAGLSAPGVEPFVGDVAVVDRAGTVRQVAPLPRAPAGWRE